MNELLREEETSWLFKVMDTCEHLPQLIAGAENVRSTHQRLAAMQNHICTDQNETGEQDGDNFLRGQLLALGRLQRMHCADKNAVSYWRHGSECGNCRDGNEDDFRNALQPPRLRYAERLRLAPGNVDGDLSQPGMGLEMECLASFMAGSTKRQMLQTQRLKRLMPERKSETAKTSNEAATAKLIAVMHKNLVEVQEGLEQLAKRGDPATRLAVAQAISDQMEALWMLANDCSVDLDEASDCLADEDCRL